MPFHNLSALSKRIQVCLFRLLGTYIEEEKNGQLLIVLMGIAEYLTTCNSHIPLSMVITKVPLNRLASSLIPAADKLYISLAR